MVDIVLLLFILFQMENIDFVRPFISKFRFNPESFSFIGVINAEIYASRAFLRSLSCLAMDVYVARSVYLSDISSAPIL